MLGRLGEWGSWYEVGFSYEIRWYCEWDSMVRGVGEVGRIIKR